MPPSRSLVSSYTFDDKDLDDADLWAVIDSAAAAVCQANNTTTTLAVGKSPKPLAIRYPNYNSPPTPVSCPPPQQQKLLQAPNHNPSFTRRSNEESPRPNKIARSRVLSEASSESPLALVTTANRNSTPIISSTKFSSPESYLSPGIRQSTPFPEVSPSASCVKNDAVNEMRHSLSGSFPSATLFKEYQNTAMAVFRFPLSLKFSLKLLISHGNAIMIDFGTSESFLDDGSSNFYPRFCWFRESVFCIEVVRWNVKHWFACVILSRSWLVHITSFLSQICFCYGYIKCYDFVK